MISFRSQAQYDKDAAVLLISEEQWKSRKFSFDTKIIKNEINAISDAEQFSGENGEVFPVATNKKFFLLVGVGSKKKTSLTELRITLRMAFLSTYLKKIKDVELIAHDQDEDILKAVIEGILIGTYRWKKYVSKPKDDKSVDQKNIYLIADKRKSLEDSVTICAGVGLARDLVNENADVKNSTYLEKTIRDLVRGRSDIELEVLAEKELKAKGLNLILTVNQGSNKEPRLIVVKYKGGKASDDYVAVIGKGLTFDTGGLNIKTTGHMETMRCDMSGAAAVIGILKNTLALNLKKNVIFAIGIAENAIDANAYKPGDVFKSYSGKTVEIGNTDAEGRLVLADTISYVVRNYKPKKIVDLATLTGACVIALGYDYSGLIANDDVFSRQLIHSSNATDDRAWRLPNYPEIKNYVKSTIADIKNVGLPKGAAGTLTAAEFLRQFTEDVTWAHFDIAGTAFVDGQGRMYYGHGATGAGVRLLTHYLQNN